MNSGPTKLATFLNGNETEIASLAHAFLRGACHHDARVRTGLAEILRIVQVTCSLAILLSARANIRMTCPMDRDDTVFNSV
jgi:hypothetical protein